MFEKVTIIGMGLIGSSLARAIRQNNLAKKIVAADASAADLTKLRREVRTGFLELRT